MGIVTEVLFGSEMIKLTLKDPVGVKNGSNLQASANIIVRTSWYDRGGN
jgi:hypothetical protein